MNELSYFFDLTEGKLANDNVYAERIAYGFVHDQFNREFEQPGYHRFVDLLTISDGFIDLTTRPGIPFYIIQYRGSAFGACWSCDGLSNTPDITMNFTLTQYFSNGEKSSVTRVTNLEEGVVTSVEGPIKYIPIGDYSPWYTAAYVYLDECDNVSSVEGVMEVIDRDSFLTFGDDYLTTIAIEWQPNCTELESRAQRYTWEDRWGTVDSKYEYDNPVPGQTLHVTLYSRLVLGIR